MSLTGEMRTAAPESTTDRDYIADGQAPALSSVFPDHVDTERSIILSHQTGSEERLNSTEGELSANCDDVGFLRRRSSE